MVTRIIPTVVTKGTLFKTPLVLPAVVVPQLPPAMLAPLCAGDRPLLLLPVRLETRFFAQPDGSSQLRVRVYPDKIHIDSHEPELTPSEQEWGAHYWQQDWRAGNDTQARVNAWRQLAERFGAARAAWVVWLLRPTNAAQRPTASVAPTQPLTVAPQFPPVAVVADGKDAAWRHAPHARLMPDHWTAIVQSGGRPVLAVDGRNIQLPLAVGPDPQAAAATVGDDQVAVDNGMRWMLDFDAAEAVGMALRIAVPAAVLAAGIDSLVVLGAAVSRGADQTAAELADLLDGQHYTDGLAFMRLGTPTNNTADRRAGYSADDPGQQASFESEIATNADALDAGTNALRLGAALGLAPERARAVLGRLGNAAQRHDLDARSMNTALWQAGWGYYLSNMVGLQGTGLTPEHIAWAREHFGTHVRAGGPLPPLRCGRQPYGVLPVTSLDLWAPRPAEAATLARETWLRGLLVKLRDGVWRPRLAEVARVGRQDPPDPDADLAQVMRTEALSSGYNVRSLLGRHYLQHLRAFLAEDLQASGFIGAQDTLTGGLPQKLGFAWRARLTRATYAEMAWPVTAPLVQAGEVSPWRPLQPNYIQQLLAEPLIQKLVDAPPVAGTPLLQTLLRHAQLREYAHAAALIAAGVPGADLATLWKDEELVDLTPGMPRTDTWKRQLDRSVAPVTGGQTIRQFLERLTTFTAPPVAALGAFRQSLAHLQGLDSEALQFLMQGTLDLGSHRLDAWIGSFATQRLAALRRTAPQGLYAGGYGWVENLRPTPNAAAAPVTPPPGEAAPLTAAANDSGFIHAPSMAHAATAALLRNAQLGASGVPRADGPFSIDLSSRRLREAGWLLDGVRQGQPVGALLGYRLERRLHELGMDRFIQPLRELAPLSAGRLQPVTGPLERIAANNVVDGLSLQRQWLDPQGGVTRRLQQAGATTADLGPIGQELDALGDTIDATSDALTAEAAYQMVRGNTSRTASTLQAISQGDAPAPELEVARTPRTGNAITHRVLVLFSGPTPATTGWAAVGTSARAKAEPMLNGWAARLLGDPRKTRCTVERLDAPGGQVLETRTLLLSELQLTPLDVVYGVEATVANGRSSSAPDAIEQRVLYQARHQAGGFGADAVLRLQHARPANLAATERTLLDVLEQARAARQLFVASRALEPGDLDPPERAGSGTTQIDPFASRVASAEASLAAAHKALDGLRKTGLLAGAEALRVALLKLGGFGIGGAVPVSAAGDDDAARNSLLLQAGALLKDSQARLDQGAALRALPVAADDRPRCARLAERLRAVFGAGFVALPGFGAAPAVAAELAGALTASTALQGGDPLEVHTWFTRSERVRDGVARLGAPLRGAEVLGTGDRLELRVAQLPLAANERWVGLAPPAGKDVATGKLSLVIQSSGALDPSMALSGLWVDEWVEVVPSRTETTAIGFQYNPPDACAPQSLLLAVPPVPDTAWTVATLHRVLIETLDLAKLRAVDAEALGEAAHYLPALLQAFNVKNDAVSTDFAPLTGNGP